MNNMINLNLEKNKVVIFADILGFSKKIRDINEYQAEIQKNISNKEQTNGCIKSLSNIYKIVTKIDNSDIIQDCRDYKFAWLSDSIILISSYKNVGFILDRIANMSLLLSTFNMLLRGGISCGDLHDSDNIMGVPFIEAVELEKEANYPRMLITEKNYTQIEPYFLGRYNILKNYFKPIKKGDWFEFDFIEYNILGGLKNELSTLILEKYVELIENEIDTIKGNSRVSEKYLWLSKKLLSITMNYAKDIDKKSDDFQNFKNSQDVKNHLTKYIADIL